MTMILCQYHAKERSKKKQTNTKLEQKKQKNDDFQSICYFFIQAFPNDKTNVYEFDIDDGYNTLEHQNNGFHSIFIDLTHFLNAL